MIRGYVGPPGVGKTYWLTRDAVRWLRRPERSCGCGREGCWGVVSNYRVLDPVSGRGAVQVDVSKGLGEVYAFGLDHRERGGSLAALTEMGQQLPARMWAETSTWALFHTIPQTRHFLMHLVWDAQTVSMVDKTLRDNTHEVAEVTVPIRHFWRVDDHALADLETFAKPRQPWLMRAEFYRPRHVEVGERTKLGRRLAVKKVRFDPRIAAAYDTLELHEGREETERPARRGRRAA